MSKVVIGVYEIKEPTEFNESYECARHYTTLRVEPCVVEVFKFNQDACYKVHGVVVADDDKSNIGATKTITAQPYAYNMIENKNFTPNEMFFTCFPYLKNKYEKLCH
jgi:hypothetical protein